MQADEKTLTLVAAAAAADTAVLDKLLHAVADAVIRDNPAIAPW